MTGCVLRQMPGGWTVSLRGPNGITFMQSAVTHRQFDAALNVLGMAKDALAATTVTVVHLDGTTESAPIPG